MSKQIEFENMTPEQVLMLLAKRLHGTIKKVRKGVKRKEIAEDKAKGMVIGRMQNILSYIKEIKDTPNFEIHPAIITSYEMGERYLNINDVLALSLEQKEKGLIDRCDMSLNDLEMKANVQEGISGHGYCTKCGRTLTNVSSVASGIGPICATKNKK